MGYNALVLSISAAMGPTIASLILSVAPWPWLFAVNVPVGIASYSRSAIDACPRPAGTGAGQTISPR